MSNLAEYKVLQAEAVATKDKESEAYAKINDQMDVLWIRLEMGEREEARLYWRELLGTK